MKIELIKEWDADFRAWWFKTHVNGKAVFNSGHFNEQSAREDFRVIVENNGVLPNPDQREILESITITEEHPISQ